MASSPTFACLRVWGRLGAESRMPWALQLPRAPRLQASTVPGCDGGAMLVSPLPSPTPCPSKLEAGVALLQPGVQPQASKHILLSEDNPFPRLSNLAERTNTYPATFPSWEQRDRRDGSRLTGPPPPSQYCCPLSTTPTKYRRGAEAKAGGERATSFLGALQQCSPGAQLLHVLLLEKRLHLVSTRHLSPASSSPSPSISPLPCSLHPPPAVWDIKNCSKNP